MCLCKWLQKRVREKLPPGGRKRPPTSTKKSARHVDATHRSGKWGKIESACRYHRTRPRMPPAAATRGLHSQNHRLAAVFRALV